MDAYNQDNLIPGPENEELMVQLPPYHGQQQGQHPPHATPGTVPVYAKVQPRHVHTANGQSTVVTQPMVAAGPLVGVQRPQNWMVPAILVCLCCFCPTGILAICYANKGIAVEAFNDIGLERMAQACEHVGKGVSQSKTKTDYYIDEQMKETVVINLTDESDTDSSYTYIAPP